MPMAIPLIAAYASVAGGLAMAAGAVTVGSMVVSGMMIAGGVMTGLGAISKDKQLSKWGGLLSLAGGAAGLASGAWSNTASQVATDASYTNSMDMASDAANSAAANSTSADYTNSLDRLNDGTGTTTVSDAASTAGPNAPTAQPLANSQVTSNSQPLSLEDGEQAMYGGNVQGTRPTPAVTQAQAATPNAPPYNGAVDRYIAGSTNGAPMSSGGGMLDSIKGAGEWAKANPRLVQAGTGLLGPMLSAYYQDKAVKEQMSAAEAAAERARQRMNESVTATRVPSWQPAQKGG